MLTSNLSCLFAKAEHSRRCWKYLWSSSLPLVNFWIYFFTYSFYTSNATCNIIEVESLSLIALTSIVSFFWLNTIYSIYFIPWILYEKSTILEVKLNTLIVASSSTVITITVSFYWLVSAGFLKHICVIILWFLKL